MELDQTRIAIRERAMLEILDLSLHVMRCYARPMLVMFAIGVVPFIVLNYFLIGWMADIAWEEEFPYGFMWSMFVLVYVQAPLASVFATCYLGQAVFQQRPSIRHVIHDVWKLSHRILWCQVCLRGVGVICVLFFMIERYREYPGTQEFVIHVLVLCILIVRSFRPFINEIIVLEKNPLRSANEMMQTVKLRSDRLHKPSSGELFSKSLGSMLLGVIIWMGVYGAILFLSGVFLNSWRQGPIIITWCYPLSLWIVVFYFTVVRFLCYLDLRIRQEGWEVELKLRAEAAKLTGKFA